MKQESRDFKSCEVQNTPNVRAEASNSLSLFGRISASHLVQIFLRDDHWLVRRSILAALVEMDCPEEVVEVCILGLEGDNAAVQEASVDALGSLATSRQSEVALSQLLNLKNSESEYIRVRVAYALKHFNIPEAKEALAQLREDADHRVVGAAMENLALLNQSMNCAIASSLRAHSARNATEPYLR